MHVDPIGKCTPPAIWTCTNAAHNIFLATKIWRSTEYSLGICSNRPYPSGTARSVPTSEVAAILRHSQRSSTTVLISLIHVTPQADNMGLHHFHFGDHCEAQIRYTSNEEY